MPKDDDVVIPYDVGRSITHLHNRSEQFKMDKKTPTPGLIDRTLLDLPAMSVEEAIQHLENAKNPSIEYLTAEDHAKNVAARAVLLTDGLKGPLTCTISHPPVTSAGKEMLQRCRDYFGGRTLLTRAPVVVSAPFGNCGTEMPTGLDALNKHLRNGLPLGSFSRYSGHSSMTKDCLTAARTPLTSEEMIMGHHMWQTVRHGQAKGGGFRRGELALPQSPYLYPSRYRHPGIWRNSFLGGLRKNALFLCLEDSGFINHYRDGIERERNLFSGLRFSDTYEDWPYTGSLSVPVFSSFFAKAVEEFSANANPTYIKLEYNTLYVGGKKIHTFPARMVRGDVDSWICDSITLRAAMRAQSSSSGAIIDRDVEYMYQHAMEPLKVFLPLEPWAERAVESLVHIQLYGRMPGRDRNGNLLVRLTHTSCMSRVRNHIVKTRQRLNDARYPEKETKRGY